MFTLNEKKIKENYDKKSDKIDESWDHVFLNDYLQNYVEFIDSKKLLKNCKIINECEDIDPYKFIYKKYLPKEQIFLGAGAYGQVYKLNNNIVVKIENLYGDLFSLKQKLDEFKISKIAGKHNIGPKIYINKIIFNIFNANIYVLTYMEYIDGITFIDYKNKVESDKESYEIIDKINKIISIKKKLLHKLGFIHNDLHSGNIMIKFKDNKIVNVYIIDFGRSKKINNMNNFYFDYENYYKFKLNYFINKKYIQIYINNILSNKIEEIYNNILINKNIVANPINNIYNINKLCDVIISKFINNNKKNKIDKIDKSNNIFKNIYKIEDLVKNYFIEKEIPNNDIKNYNFFKASYYPIFKIYYCNDNSKNKYLCIIYKVYFDNINYFIEQIKDGFNISKILYKNKLGLNFLEYNFMKLGNDHLMSFYIKLEENTELNSITSINKISKLKIQNYIIDFIKKIIDLKIYFKNADIISFKRSLFLYNNSIYYYNFLNLSSMKNLLKKQSFYNKPNNILSNNQKIEFINQLVKNKLIVLK